VFGCNFVWRDDIEDDLDSTLFNPVALQPFQDGGRLTPEACTLIEPIGGFG
jgi:hypothetical protein